MPKRAAEGSQPRREEEDQVAENANKVAPTSQKPRKWGGKHEKVPSHTACFKDYPNRRGATSNSAGLTEAQRGKVTALNVITTKIHAQDSNLWPVIIPDDRGKELGWQIYKRMQDHTVLKGTVDSSLKPYFKERWERPVKRVTGWRFIARLIFMIPPSTHHGQWQFCHL